MYLENKQISARQGFKLGLIQNITFAVILGPAILAKGSGNNFMSSLIIGAACVAIYYLIIYICSKMLDEDGYRQLNRLSGLYIVRYVIRAAVVIAIIINVINHYTITDIGTVLPAILLSLLVVYGGSKGMEKYARLCEILYWWIIGLLLIVAVSLVCNLRTAEVRYGEYAGLEKYDKSGGYEAAVSHLEDDKSGRYREYDKYDDYEDYLEDKYGENYSEYDKYDDFDDYLEYKYGDQYSEYDKYDDYEDYLEDKYDAEYIDYDDYDDYYEDEWDGIIKTAYAFMMLFSGFELMLFVFGRQSENMFSGTIKLWFFSMLAAVVSVAFVIGLAGDGWARRDLFVAFDVACLTGGNIFSGRMDYLLMLFMVCGGFVLASGYLCVAGEMAGRMINRVKTKLSLTETIVYTLLITGIVVLLINSQSGREPESAVWYYLMKYILYIDIPIGIIIPVVISLKNARKLTATMLVLLVAGTMTGCMGNKGSIENQDYVRTLEINDETDEEGYRFDFEIAKLEDYKGDAEGLLDTTSVIINAKSLTSALECYEEEKDRALDIGHMTKIKLEDLKEKNALVSELAELNQIDKKINVELADDVEIPLFNLISYTTNEEADR